jgi:transcriptional regulator of acetoin/glycerol metabolism
VHPLVNKRENAGERKGEKMNSYKNILEAVKDLESEDFIKRIDKEGFIKFEVPSGIFNEQNVIKMTILKQNEHIALKVNTITAGLGAMEELLELFKYLHDNNIKISSEDEAWLDIEVVKGFCDVRDKIKSNRITIGMNKSNKELGRPSDPAKIKLAMDMYNSGNYTGEQIARLSGVSRTTLYRHLNKLKKG